MDIDELVAIHRDDPVGIDKTGLITRILIGGPLRARPLVRLERVVDADVDDTPFDQQIQQFIRAIVAVVSVDDEIGHAD